ncbi:hypothetical protein HDU83_009685 [Entophlyctis luteolus]|nr:hypothetical protein HDU83_009685 [Entophlyctis luteolus]
MDGDNGDSASIFADPDADVARTRILQHYRDGDPIVNFTRSLRFDLAQSLAADCAPGGGPSAWVSELCLRRVRFHRMKESLRDQIAWCVFNMAIVVDSMSKQNRQTKASFRVGFLLSDILPDTCEFDAKMCIDALVSLQPLLAMPLHIVVLGRRDNISKWSNQRKLGAVIDVVWDWERNLELLPSIDMLVVLTSAMHLTLVEEQLRGHDYSKTLVVSAIPGIAEKRASILLQTTLLFNLTWDFDESHAKDDKPQNVGVFSCFDTNFQD